MRIRWTLNKLKLVDWGSIAVWDTQAICTQLVVGPCKEYTRRTLNFHNRFSITRIIRHSRQRELKQCATKYSHCTYGRGFLYREILCRLLNNKHLSYSYNSYSSISVIFVYTFHVPSFHHCGVEWRFRDRWIWVALDHILRAGMDGAIFGRVFRTVYHILWYRLMVMVVRISWIVCWWDSSCRAISHDRFCLMIGAYRIIWATRVVMKSLCWVDSVRNTIVVTRSSTCVVLHIISLRLGRADWDRVLEKLVVISRRCVVRSSNLSVYRR